MIELNISYSSFIIIFSNVLLFMLMESAFFWFVIGNNLDDHLRSLNWKDDKTNYLKQIIGQNKYIEDSLNIFKNNTDMESLRLYSIASYEYRYNHNIIEFSKWIICPIALTALILIICIFIEFKYKKRFDNVDLKILFFVIFSFLTEIIFYFVVIYDSNMLSDVEFIEIILSNFVKL